jgi:hypothetical protein
MNLDDHPYLAFYLVGCAAAFCLAFVVQVEAYFIGWATKGNTLRKNLKKIQDPAGNNFKVTVSVFAFGLVSGVISSWIGVLQYFWRIVWMPMSVLREALTSTPEEIKLLRFPLMNNPTLSREAVFAYAYALGVKAGSRPDAWQIANELKEIEGYHPTFNCEIALQTLNSLNAIDPQTLSEALARMKEAD